MNPFRSLLAWCDASWPSIDRSLARSLLKHRTLDWREKIDVHVLSYLNWGGHPERGHIGAYDHMEGLDSSLWTSRRVACQDDVTLGDVLIEHLVDHFVNPNQQGCLHDGRWKHATLTPSQRPMLPGMDLASVIRALTHLTQHGAKPKPFWTTAILDALEIDRFYERSQGFIDGYRWAVASSSGEKTPIEPLIAWALDTWTSDDWAQHAARDPYFLPALAAEQGRLDWLISMVERGSTLWSTRHFSPLTHGLIHADGWTGTSKSETIAWLLERHPVDPLVEPDGSTPLHHLMGEIQDPGVQAIAQRLWPIYQPLLEQQRAGSELWEPLLPTLEELAEGHPQPHRPRVGLDLTARWLRQFPLFRQSRWFQAPHANFPSMESYANNAASFAWWKNQMLSQQRWHSLASWDGLHENDIDGHTTPSTESSRF